MPRLCHTEELNEQYTSHSSAEMSLLWVKTRATFSIAQSPFITVERCILAVCRQPKFTHPVYIFSLLLCRRQRVTDSVGACSLRTSFLSRCSGSPSTPCYWTTSPSTQVLCGVALPIRVPSQMWSVHEISLCAHGYFSAHMLTVCSTDLDVMMIQKMFVYINPKCEIKVDKSHIEW